MSNPFIGRGEDLVEKIISRLYKFTETHSQVPILNLVDMESAKTYNEEFAKHKCDKVITVLNSEDKLQTLVIEVNYKHGNKAAKKWLHNFAPDVKRTGRVPVTIDDYDCRSSVKKDGKYQLGLFHQNSKNQHKLSWNDFRDVIDALEKAGVEP